MMASCFTYIHCVMYNFCYMSESFQSLKFIVKISQNYMLWYFNREIHIEFALSIFALQLRKLQNFLLLFDTMTLCLNHPVYIRVLRKWVHFQFESTNTSLKGNVFTYFNSTIKNSRANDQTLEIWWHTGLGNWQASCVFDSSNLRRHLAHNNFSTSLACIQFNDLSTRALLCLLSLKNEFW